MKKAVSIFAVLLTGAFATACLDDSITGTRPVAFTLTSSTSTAQVGDSITFSYEATGTGILGVIMNFGDGRVDSTDVAEMAGGSNIVEYSDQPKHAYTAGGTYEVIGRLETVNGFRSDTVEVQINP